MVLAREVSMEEVATIRQNTDIEIEAFIHGGDVYLLFRALYIV